MEHPLVAHFVRRAAEVDDCADVEIDDDERGSVVSISPHREGAVGVYLTAWDPDDESLISFDGDDFWPEEIREAHEVDWFLDAAIEGRVRVLRGPRRGVALVDEGEGYKRFCSWSEGLLSLVPRPGWRRRAAMVDYQPYRS